ncbi:hypothetical protein ACJX0J_017707, partial [Zea mays]
GASRTRVFVFVFVVKMDLNVEQDLSARTQYPDNDVFVCHLITLSQDLIAYGDGASLNWPQEEVVNFSSRDWKKPKMIKKLIGKNIKHVAIPYVVGHCHFKIK